MASVERPDLTGQVVDTRYRVLAPIGQGGMGSVYRAEDLKLRKVVAIKVINEQVPNEMSSRRRFEREAQAMAKLEHPHCASILDVGMHGDQPFVVMDYISGQSLDALVAEGPLPIVRAVEITRQILFGLAHAHEHGIIHRDIKPSNIVLSQKAGMGDHVKILDFGLAKLNQESSNLTAGMVVGTPAYMAPEQIRSLVLDARADIYACGVLLFELLTGHKPFRSATADPLAVCMMHLNDPPPRLSDAAPGTEFGALEDVVAQALEKDRDRRFATAEAFAHALATTLPALPEPAGRPTPLPRPQTPSPRPQTPSPLAATVSFAEADLVPEPSPAPEPRSTIPEPGPTIAARPPRPVSTARPRRGKRWLAVSGILAVAAVAIVVVVARTRDSSPSPSPPTSPTPNHGSAPGAAPSLSDPPASAAEDPIADLLAQADELLSSNRREAAVKLLAKARKTNPQDARLPYRLGLLYFDQMWLSEALKQSRAAIQLDPSYKTDQKLIEAAVRAFSTTAGYDWTLANFLRNDIGDAAKPVLEDTAKNHRNPIVRNRAAAELRRYR